MKNPRNIFIRTVIFNIILISGIFSTFTKAQQILSLEDAIEVAGKNSPAIQESELRLEQSRESLNAQQAALKSQFRLSLNPVNYQKDRQFNDLFSIYNTTQTFQSFGTFSITQPIIWTDATLSLVDRLQWQNVYSEFQDQYKRTFNNNLYLSLEQPLFTYNRTELQLKELELNLENTMLSYSIQKLALEKDVTQSFYNVYQQQMRLQIAEDENKNQENSYNIIKNKVDAGIAAMEELYQAELNLATSKSDLENQQVALDNALDDFKILIGISIYDEISIVANISESPVQVDLKKAIDNGLNQRMEIRQREIDIENAQNDIVRTESTNEFYGNLSLSLGLIGTAEKFNDLYKSPTENQRVSLSFEIPLFDWGEQESLENASQAAEKVTEINLTNEKNNIILGIRRSYRNLLNLENQIEIARQNEKNAQLTYEINLERYKNGDLTSLDLNMYQNQLSQSKMDLVNALINYKIELLNLKIQSLWDFAKQEPVVPEFKKNK